MIDNKPFIVSSHCTLPKGYGVGGECDYIVSEGRKATA